MFDQLQPVTISSRAADEIRKIMQTKNIPEGYGLRVGVKGGGGCGGVSLILGFDKMKDTDLSYSVDDIPIYIDKKHTLTALSHRRAEINHARRLALAWVCARDDDRLDLTIRRREHDVRAQRAAALCDP